MTLQKLTRKDLLCFTLPWLTPLVATGLALLLASVMPAANLALIYLAAVLVTAISTRVWPALVCALLSFAAYNFFLTEPRYSLRMLHREDALTAALLAMVALITGQMAGRLSEQVAALRASERWNEQQMACARALSVCVDRTTLIKAFAVQLEETLDWYARSVEPDATTLSASPRTVSWHEDPGGVNVLFHGSRGEAANTIRLSATEPTSAWHRERLDVLVNLASLAWGRIELGESLKQETLDKEREQLRSALLSSVSHDLRTPLSTMIGSVSSLIDLSDSLDASQRAELLDNTLTEARRLDRYIQKLLDMTRLGHGELSLDRDWIGLDDLISVVIRRSRPLLKDIELKIDIPPDLPLLHVHPALIEQALFNVLENAIRFSPANGHIRLQALQDDNWLHLDVSDSGPGIAPDKRAQVFDMFHTFSHGDQYAAGTGLGLAICRSIVAAHGGRTSVEDSAPGDGARVRISLPLATPTTMQEDDL
ncbi:hypothetical protein GCM10007418_08630 [Halopseudomonas salina]|uniref:histidine kinase n=2 Tax=Halopseudomonas salina TaxID=1323744 RepID=A0ABQ1P551_9GAMM|nr:hypothetical protein GCM10007418_08630 [Halopseudomonas salina]